MATDSSKRAQAALLLSTGLSAVSVAREIGVTPETISRWKISPDFQASINAHQAERIAVTREQIRESSKKAVETINNLMASPSETIRLKAAVSMLRFGNFDQPQRLFAGVGPTEPLDVLGELKKQMEVEQFIFRGSSYLD